MRNNFGKNEQNRFGFNRENDLNLLAHASSPDQLAIVWNEAGEVVAATPVPGDTPGSYDMDLARLPADFNLAAALRVRRASYRDLPPLSEETLFSTVVPDFSERTRILALNGDALAFDDDDLAQWLLSAEQQITLGTDNHPIFETALEDTACSVVRLPNGQISMTEVPRQQVNQTRDKVYMLLGEELPEFLNLTIETSLRCIVRYFLNAVPEGEETLRSGKEKEVTAFLLITKSGFSYGLWSPSAGLFSEYAFLAPTEISQAPRETNQKSQTTSQPTVPAPEEVEKAHRRERLDSYIKHAFEQLFLQLSDEKLEQLQLSNYAQMVWVSEIGLSDTVAPIAAEYSAQTGLEFFQIPIPFDEAVAGGLLFGSFTFGDEIVMGAELLPPVNMARDILALADKEETEYQQMEEVQVQKQQSRAVFRLFAAPVLALAIILAMTANIIRTQTMTLIRERSADAKTLELKPALDRRKSYEANLKWYQEFIKQVSLIRRQQPVGINLLYELNSNYPFNIDSSFYVSDLKLLVNGGVEIKGLASNKDAVTSFLRSLEFAGGTGSGTRLFSNLTYEVQEGVANQTAPTGAQPNLPTMAGSALTGNRPPPGVIAWSIKGNYLPIEEFLPPDPKKKPPPAQTPPNANANANTNQASPPAVPKASP